MHSITHDKKWRFQLLSEGLLRIEYSPKEKFTDAPSSVVLERPEKLPFMNEMVQGDHFLITGGAFEIRIRTTQPDLPPSEQILISWERGGRSGSRNLSHDASNLGGDFFSLDLCGQGDRTPRSRDGVLSREGCYIFDDSPSPLLDETGNLTNRPDPEAMDLYFFAYGNDYAAGLYDFGRLLGFPPMLPKHLLGFWWSRWHPYSEDDAINLVERFASHGMPLSVLVLDMDWHREGWCNWDWDRDLLPDPDQFIKRLEKHDVMLTLNVHPQEIESHDSHYKSFMKKAGIPSSKRMKKHSIDLSDSKQRKAAEDILIKPFHDQGIDFWWIDGQAAHVGPKISHQLWTNHVYFNATAEKAGKKRPVIFSRCGGWGSGRYPIGFSGDAESVWSSLKHEIPFTATGGNIGFGWWSNDTGGFTGDHLTEDLYIRWFQFSALSPILRMHSMRGLREPWSYGALANTTAIRFFDLRRRLFPYIYTAMRKNSKENLPLCAPLYLYNPDDDAAYEHPEEYYFGDAFLCAPVFEPQVETGGIRTVYFPKGLWRDWFAGDVFKGPALRRIYCPLTRMPVFQKAGTPVPMRNPENGNLEWIIFDAGRGESELYEDDGETVPGSESHYCNRKVRFFSGGDKSVFEADPKEGDFPGISDGEWNIILKSSRDEIQRKFTPPDKKTFRMEFPHEGNHVSQIKNDLIKTDLLRRMQVALVLEEKTGAPEEVLNEYRRLISLRNFNRKKWDAFLEKRLEFYLNENLKNNSGELQMLMQELAGITTEVRLSDCGRPDELYLTARIYPSTSMNAKWAASLKWNIPEEWIREKGKAFRRKKLAADVEINSRCRIGIPPGDSISLGESVFSAEITLQQGKRQIKLHPEASLDLSAVRDFEIIAPFPRDSSGLDRICGPEKDQPPKEEYPGAYGPVKWRKAHIPIDGRDLWGNFPVTNLHNLIDSRGGGEIAFIRFTVNAERAGRYNMTLKIDEPAHLYINRRKEALELKDWYHRVFRIDLDKGKNEILIKTQRTWGDWDFGAGFLQFGVNKPANELFLIGRFFIFPLI